MTNERAALYEALLRFLNTEVEDTQAVLKARELRLALAREENGDDGDERDEQAAA